MLHHFRLEGGGEVVFLQKERKRTKETVVGGILDDIDRGCKLVRIPKTEI